MIGPVVKTLRTERKLSQEALAAAAGVSSGYLSKLERGVYKEPSYEVLSRIAGALTMSVNDLYAAAGLEYLLAEADLTSEPAFEPFAPRLEGFARRDQQIIMGEIRRIFLEEEKESG